MDPRLRTGPSTGQHAKQSALPRGVSLHNTQYSVPPVQVHLRFILQFCGTVPHHCLNYRLDPVTL